MIHEAARPFVTQQLFSDLMQENFPAVAPVAPIDGAIAVGDEFHDGDIGPNHHKRGSAPPDVRYGDSAASP